MNTSWLSGFLATIILGGLLPAVPGLAAEQGTIRVGLNNWPENIAVSNMWKHLLEEKGYDVELTSAGKSVVYAGVAGGSLDVGFEVWMPKTDKPFYERFEEDIALHEPWYRGTRLGLVVPAYVDVESIAELNDHKQPFTQDGKPSIVGIDPGAALMGLTEKAIEQYGLDFRLVGSSSPAMTAALDRAINADEAIVVTLWNPHWTFAEYDLKYLDDPKGVYGAGEDIHWMSGTSFEERHPDPTRWFNNWEMSDQQLGSLMARVREVGDAEQATAGWIEENRKLVDGWMSTE